MGIFQLMFVLCVIGVIMYLINVYIGPKMKPPFLTILNVVIIIAVVLWLASVFGLMPSNANIRVGR